MMTDSLAQRVTHLRRKRKIVHMDMDCFYVSVERLHDPSLEGRPVIVGADPGGRGVVCAASYEARKFGVHSAMPISRAQRLCPQAAFIRPGRVSYSEYSRKVRKILARTAPVVEQASIDEFNLDFSGCERLYGDIFETIKGVKKAVKNELGLPSSWGLGTSRMIAKIAANSAKPNGAREIQPGAEREFLAQLPMSAMPGIGRVTGEKFARLGLETLGDVAGLSAGNLTKLLGMWGEYLFYRVRGLDDSDLAEAGIRRSASSEITFDEDTENPDFLLSALSHISEKLGSLLRDEELLTRTITLKLRYSDFKTTTSQKAVPSTDVDYDIFETARRIFEAKYTRRVRLRLIGIKVSKLVRARTQKKLFIDIGDRRRACLGGVDLVREKYGFNAVRILRSAPWMSKEFTYDAFKL